MLNCKIKIVKGLPISIHINSASDLKIYRNLDIYYESNSIPIDAVNKPLDKEKIIEQISKTNNTPFYFKTIKITLDDNSFITNIKALNDLRRSALTMVEDTIKKRTSRKEIVCNFKNASFKQKQTEYEVYCYRIGLLRLNIGNQPDRAGTRGYWHRQ